MHIRFWFFLLLVNVGVAQEIFCDKLKKVNTLLQEHHFSPKSVDDSLSYHIYTDFIESLGSSRTLFTKKESAKLAQHQLQLEDYINNSDCSFISDFEDNFKKGLERKIDFYSKMEKEKFSYSKNETLTFDKNPPDFFTSENEIYDLLKKRLKMDVLVDISAVSTNKDSLQKVFSKLESETKKRLIEQEKCKLSYLLNQENSFSNEVENRFLKTFVSYFDPHSAFFSNTEKTIFINGVSEDNFTYGINFMLSDANEFYIVEIIPGSSAFENEALELNDKLIKLEENDIEIWANCSNFSQVLNSINSKQINHLIFYFKKQDGTIYNVNLQKKSIKAIDNKCYSFIISYENENYGYINIPSFYVDDNGNNFLSNDLMFEIMKLQKQQIKGLVIDLEDNGGGNIYEALKVCGMFIDIGPIAQIAQKDEAISVLRDVNRGINYSGPIAVLINGNSASASEFFANAIQDYGRGIIVGQKSFGKASMQTIFPLDETSNQTDFIKITGGKFYRVTGKSNQKNGVIPDIEIPSIYDNLLKRENDLPFLLPNDEIEAVPRFTKWNKNYTSTIKKSKARLQNSAFYNDILKYQKQIDNIFDLQGKKVVLNFSSVFEFVNQYNSLYKEIEKLENETLVSKIQFTLDDAEKFKYDVTLQSIFEIRKEKLKSNYSLLEAIHILNDINN